MTSDTKTSNTQSRYWCFTAFDVFNELSFDKAAYAVWQLEEAPTTKLQHYQGYIALDRAQRFSYVQDMLPKGTHIERAYGSIDKNIKYCTKEVSRLSGPWSHGIKPEKAQGTRTDLHDFKDAVCLQASKSETLDDYPSVWCKYPKFYDTIKTIVTPDRSTKTEVIWIYGPSGCGKTRLAYNSYPEAYWKPAASKWWDGYDGQATVIMDDFFAFRDFEITYYLNLFDRYPMQIEIKGGFRKFTSNRIVVTSNVSPDDFMAHQELMPVHKQAFLRRIDCIIPMKETHVN